MDTVRLSDVRENQDIKPSSSNEGVLSKQDSYSERNLCSELKSLNKIQNFVKIFKSHEAQDSLCKVSQNIHECCLSESCSQHLLLTTLMDIITSCTHSVDVLQNYVKHSLHCSRKCSTSANNQERVEKGSCDVGEQGLVKILVQDIVHALVGTLPNFFTGDSKFGKEFKDQVDCAENSRDICACELKSAWIIMQKMLLFQPLDGNKREKKYSIDELVRSLLSANFPSESESDTCPPLNDDDSFLSESISSIYLLPVFDDGSSIRANGDDVKPSLDLSLESEFNYIENGYNLTSINTNVQRQYLKITHIESPFTSDEFFNENGSFEAELNGKDTVENDDASLDENSRDNASIGVISEKCNDSKYECKAKSLKNSKFWMSLDSLPKAKTSAKQNPNGQNKLSSHSSQNRVTDTNEKAQHVQHTLNNADNFPPNSKPATNRENSLPNSRTTSSSFTNPSSFECAEDTTRKIRTDTIDVKITNKGEGFGLILGVKYHSSRSSIVPVIHSIKPKSPAQKSGVLKVDDRIISINHQSTLGLTPNELQMLNKQSFSAEVIILKVEFDVVEAKLKFGTFDVILDKMLKIGLVFEDMKRGFPMSVSGIVRGSAAHRSGQLFPGDRIKFFRCIRNEEFDPVSCNYSREESVLITVQRDPQPGLRAESCKEQPPPPPCYFNPCFSHVDSVPRKGKSFVVRKTTVHTVGGTEALVLDQEVVLFRDPVFWDFGFLVGEDPDSGRAYVTDVRPHGPASDSGAVKKFDRIVQVNGILVDRNIENSVLTLLSQANHEVQLLIRRLYREDSNAV